MLRVHADQLPIVKGLLKNQDIGRISRYANCAFKDLALYLHQFYRDKMDQLMERNRELTTPFQNSVFACVAFNFGPRVVAIPHRDHVNLAYGWCSITALGDFDHKVGGHMVLPDLKLAIEFPAGSTILIPSAAFTHYNLPIGSEETRRLMTQFSAGGLFRWITYGCQKKGVALAASHGGTKWWEKGKGLYPTSKRRQAAAAEGAQA
ncbi:hypothetical protein BDM02DRAFT_3104900 [Thelephora ganbajun]|uniref:Uncharacterized protein n=1 Tax=Thelephora ganbajun TaxID=370292 RepID=A0ACB6Z0P9_THEGA|nr:hypothetical protein BDM02DRAFT_3104900 [Thelephora ganbajun]